MEIVKQYFTLALLPFLLVSCGEKVTPVTLSKELTDQKVTMTNSKAENKGLSVYLTTEEPIQGQLVAKALNEKSQEVGRAVTSIDLGDDDAKNFEFKFDAKLDETLVTKYLVDLKKDS
jgi:hypothetical protein